MTKEIISRCGYDIDMNFIKEKSEFMLEGKYDAHNIVFDINIVFKEQDRRFVMKSLDEIKYFNSVGKIEQNKISKLHDFLSDYELFGTTYTHLTVCNSGIIYSSERVYYFVGSDSIEGEENYIYIFSDSKLKESNLHVKYLGRIGKGNDLYMRISNMG